MQLPQDALHAGKLLQAEPQPTQLELGLEPQALIVGLLQRLQREFVEVLQKQWGD